MAAMDDRSSDPLQTTLRLLAGARGDDRAALDELFARYAPRVRRIVALRLDRPIDRIADFDDVAQEALLRAFRGLDRFRGSSVGEFRNWLARIVENTIRDLLEQGDTRKRGEGNERCFGELGDDSLASSIFAGVSPSPSEQAMGRELEQRVEAALLDLDERYREVIVLRKLCEMSYEEIAGELGLGEEGNARKICSRALRKLEDALARTR